MPASLSFRLITVTLSGNTLQSKRVQNSAELERLADREARSYGAVRQTIQTYAGYAHIPERDVVRTFTSGVRSQWAKAQ